MKSIDRLSEVVIQNDNISATQFTGSNFGKKGFATFFLSLWSPYVRIFLYLSLKESNMLKFKRTFMYWILNKRVSSIFYKMSDKRNWNYKLQRRNISYRKRKLIHICNFFVFFTELTINKTKIDETGIRFPEVTSKNSTEGSDTFSTFFELGKQKRKTDKGWHWKLLRFLF